MAQICEGRVCPSHTLAGWGPQVTRNNVPTTRKKRNLVKITFVCISKIPIAQWKLVQVL